jgi:hypothetical protein
MQPTRVLDDDYDEADGQDVADKTGRQVALAEYNYFTAVVLGYGVPTADSLRSRT